MSETKRKVFIIIVLILVILFGVGQFFAGNLNTASQQTQNPSDTNSSQTQVVAYAVATPLPAGTPVEQGSCFTNSIAAPYGADAWRCSVGNAISDPCFEFSSASSTPGATSSVQLLCGANPASSDTSSTFVLQLTKPLPKSEVPSSTPATWAWMIELSNGIVCTPFTGTRPFSAGGDVATYACNAAPPAAGMGTPMIFGDLSNATGTWTAEIGALSTATSTFPPPLVASATVPIFAAWQ